MRYFIPSVTGLQLLASIVGLFASLFPSVGYSPAFWGFSTIRSSDGPPVINSITHGSPAESAGFRLNDFILTADGTPLTFDMLQQVVEGLQPDKPVSFGVKRGDQETVIVVKGNTWRVAALYYPSFWYPLAGLLFLILGVVVFATQPLQPAPLL